MVMKRNRVGEHLSPEEIKIVGNYIVRNSFKRMNWLPKHYEQYIKNNQKESIQIHIGLSGYLPSLIGAKGVYGTRLDDVFSWCVYWVYTHLDLKGIDTKNTDLLESYIVKEFKRGILRMFRRDMELRERIELVGDKDSELNEEYEQQDRETYVSKLLSEQRDRLQDWEVEFLVEWTKPTFNRRAMVRKYNITTNGRRTFDNLVKIIKEFEGYNI